MDPRSKFQEWVLRTYTGSVKTKTITAEKYRRIVSTLKGEIFTFEINVETFQKYLCFELIAQVYENIDFWVRCVFENVTIFSKF